MDKQLNQDTKIDQGKQVSSCSPQSKPLANTTGGGANSPTMGGFGNQPSFRSRTDSVIEYTPPVVGEAAGSTFYITKAGHIDYVVLLKVDNSYWRGISLLNVGMKYVTSIMAKILISISSHFINILTK